MDNTGKTEVCAVRIPAAAKRAMVPGFLFCILVLTVLLCACGKQKTASLADYKAQLQKAKSAEKQAGILYEMAGGCEDGLCDYWGDDINPEVGKGLPEDLLPDTEGAEPVKKLPEEYRHRKWTVLFRDAGVLRLYGNLYTHLPAEMRAPSLKEAEAVLYLEPT